MNKERDSGEEKNLAERGEKEIYYSSSKICIYKDSMFNLPATQKIGQDLEEKIPTQKIIISSEVNPLTLKEEDT